MIHQYSLGGYDITLDVYSGSIHVTDGISAEAIRLCETLPDESVRERILGDFGGSVTAEEVDACLAEIGRLKREGKLYAPDRLSQAMGERHEARPDVKALCLHVAHTCNLDCSYCFAAQGRYRGERALMSLETGKRAIDFLLENSGTKRNLDVDFFGGEPLMNWGTVKEIVRYAREREQDRRKSFRFTLTTNGVLLDDEVTEFCNREMYNVVLSLDGRKEVHDRFRKDRAGRGSYDLVVPKFQRFVQRRGSRSHYVRGTFTHFNLDFFEDLMHMADLGFTQLSMEPVVCGPDEPGAITAGDLPVIFRQYELLAEEMLRRFRNGEEELVFYHFMLDLEHGPCAYKRLTGCGSGREYFAVTPSGDLFPCHQFVGDAEFLMGDLRAGITQERLRGEFGGCGVWRRSACADCWAKLYCSGACAANAFRASGSISGLYPLGCEMFKKRMECAIMLKAAASLGADGAGAPATADLQDLES